MLTKKWLGVALACLALGCGDSDNDTSPTDATNNAANNGKGDLVSGATVCTAIRGNGELIPAHFGALSRIVEEYGTIHATSGGSSASITSFLLSSIQSNPAVSECGGENCSSQEEAARVALLLKSFQGYLEFLTTTDEAHTVQAALPIVARIKAGGIEQLLESDPDGAAEALTNILESEDLVAMVNPELIKLLKDSPDPSYHVKDVMDSVNSFGSFSADDPRIFVQPGLINFEALADQMDMLGSFYAGYGPANEAAMSNFLDNCAEGGRGKVWSELSNLPSGELTCQTQFIGMLTEYRAGFKEYTGPTRGDDEVGTTMDALISTSVIGGGSFDSWNDARLGYNGANNYILETDFEDIYLGYWGSHDAMEVLELTTAREDLKSQKAMGLGPASWKEVMSMSPAEPGLSRALKLNEHFASAGGWSDLHPVLVLRDIGCDKVIYVTRTAPESEFAQGVATQLGMGEDEKSALYDLNNPKSSFSLSIAEADAVWCTDWNNQEPMDVEGLVRDAYNAPIQTADEFFAGSYGNVVSQTTLEGCH